MSAATVLQSIKTDLERVIAGLSDVDFYPQDIIDKYEQICALLDTNPHVIGTDVQAYSARLAEIVSGFTGATNGQGVRKKADGTGLEYASLAELVAAPASASASGKTGQIAIDASYVYLCTATDTWKRASLVFDTWA